jgi:arabinogalactan oligomer/maltooligosaccharide transport system substrate-binding protein
MIRKSALTALSLLLVVVISPIVNPLSGQAQSNASTSATTTVTIWFEGESPTVLEEIATGFIIMHPDTSINLEQKTDLFIEFVAAASSGGGPDMVLGPQDYIIKYAELGLIQAVDNEFNPDDFVEQTVAGALWNGHYWGVPNIYGNHLMLYYNKNLLATAPLDTTEMINVAKSLTGGNQYGLVFHIDEPFWLIPWLTGFGGWVFDESIDPPFPTLDTPEMVEALQFIHDLRYVHGIVPDGADDMDYGYNLFWDGKAAMMINGDWTLDAYRDHFGEANLGVALIPQVVETGQWPVPLVTGWYYSLNTNTRGDKLAASQAFIQYATSKPAQLLWPAETGWGVKLPALLEAFNDPVVQADPILKASADQASIGRVMPTSPSLGCVWEAMVDPLQLLWDDLITPQAAAEAMQADAEQCYARLIGRWVYLPVVIKP